MFLLPGLNQWLLRDNGITLYEACRLLHGELYGVESFDHRGPLAPAIYAVGVSIGKLADISPVYSARVFGVLIGLLVVVSVYKLARELQLGSEGAAAAAVVVACAAGLVLHFAGGPRPKVPFVLLETLAILLTVRGRYFLAGVAAGSALLVWQPGGWFVVVPIVAALRDVPSRRGRAVVAALIGALLPIATIAGIYTAVGHLTDLWREVFWFNLHYGHCRPVQTLHQRLYAIRRDLYGYYCGPVGVWALVCVALWSIFGSVSKNRGEQRRWLAVAVGLAGPVLWTGMDYQSYPDLYPFVPFIAIGIGIMVSWISAGTGTAGRAIALVGLVIALVWFAKPILGRGVVPGQTLEQEFAMARLAQRIAGAEGRLASVGAPHVMALTGWRNPSRYGFLLVGIDEYIEDTEPGGFVGWARRLLVDAPTKVVLVGQLSGRLVPRLEQLLETYYAQCASVGDVTMWVRMEHPVDR